MIHRVREYHPRVLAAQGISLHEAAPVKDLEQPLFFCFVGLLKASPFQAVHAFPVAGRHSGHIFRPLQSAFNLAGRHPGLRKLRQFIPQAYVPGTQPCAPASAVVILHPAGLGTPAAVSAPFSNHAGEQAQSAHCHTLRAMNKYFSLNTGIRTLANLFQGALPCQHRPADSVFSAPYHSCPVVNGHLGTRVHRQVREKVPGNSQHTQVLHQHSVRMKIIQQPQYLCHLCQFPVLHQRVHGHMNPHMAQMGIADGIFQLLPVKIPCTGARTESGIPKVYRVRTCRVCPFQSRAVPCRSQILHVATLLELIHNSQFIIHNDYIPAYS